MKKKKKKNTASCNWFNRELNCNEVKSFNGLLYEWQYRLYRLYNWRRRWSFFFSYFFLIFLRETWCPPYTLKNKANKHWNRIFSSGNPIVDKPTAIAHRLSPVYTRPVQKKKRTLKIRYKYPVIYWELIERREKIIRWDFNSSCAEKKKTKKRNCFSDWSDVSYTYNTLETHLPSAGYF